MQPVLPCGEAERCQHVTKPDKKSTHSKFLCKKACKNFQDHKSLIGYHPNALDPDHLLVDGSLHPDTEL